MAPHCIQETKEPNFIRPEAAEGAVIISKATDYANDSYRALTVLS